MDIKKEYERWLVNATADTDVADELKTLDDTKIEDAFYRDLAFGTGGLRGVIGAGTNRMNVYTVAKASQGLADYLKKNFTEPSVAIGYDSRIKSDVFAKVAAGVFAANGVKVNIWPTLMPVPTVSFATRYLHTSAGVMVTASHNPSKYNGYKVYGADGCQITTEAAAEILAEISMQKDRRSLHGCRRCLGKELLLPSMADTACRRILSNFWQIMLTCLRTLFLHSEYPQER